ncbi:MAG TPA: diphosphomevalonate decarboxylase [Cryomorphaceae bacterium]|nr:diphosphomevalonate decarboxylase [Cryomorphaceae bacterium]|tara:strand:+ start:468 stop:1478 length:1011 start_codon:yes stop_codon:yes gene_type:complete
MKETAWKSPSNIALVKYWGKYDVQIPANPSISFTLSEAATTTRLIYKQGTGNITIYLDGEKTPSFLPKIQGFLERSKEFFPFTGKMDFEIHTSNSFPHSSGIASSASGMSALALCMMSVKKDLGLPINNFMEEASNAARLGSGSGSRSLFGPLAAWGEHAEIDGSSNEFAVAFSDVDPIFNSFQDTILLVDKGEKTVSSTVGHGLMNGHPYAATRFEQAHKNQSALLTSLLEGDLDTFGAIVESEALTLHGMMMTSMPYFMLMKPNTLEVLNKIWAYREETKHPVYFTLDAGANVHVLYPKSHKDVIISFIDSELRTFCKDDSYLCDEVGQGPVQL